MKRFCAAGWLLLWSATALALPADFWDFESDTSDWQSPGGPGGVVVEPGCPTNHALQIAASKPHHTRLVLPHSDETPDFIAALRFRVIASAGDTPRVYLYGRASGDGFRGLSIKDGVATATGYFSKQQRGTDFGSVALPKTGSGDTWWRASIACHGNGFFAKAWPESGLEPGWQMMGEMAGHQRGNFAIGVWLSPATRSQAKVLFDDIRFRPLQAADLARMKAAQSPRTPLDLRAVPAADGPFKAGGWAGLVKAGTVLMFDPGTGNLTHLVHRATKQEFLSAVASCPLFSLQLAKDHSAKEQETSAADFRSVAVRRKGNTGWELEFTNHVSLPLSARVEIASGEDGLIHLRFKLSNRSGWAATLIRFPDMAWTAKLGKTVQDDALLLPWSDGAVQPAPGDTNKRGYAAEFPGHAFTQFTAYYDATAGLFFGALDPDGHCKRWTLTTRAGRSVQMALSHLRPDVPQESQALPYDVVLGTFTGDWMDAADIYKRWARRQPWCTRTLRQREEVPQFLKEGAGVVVGVIQDASGYNGILGDHLAKLPQLLADYRERTELAHMIFVPYGWENRGAWAGINYFPAVPSDEDWLKMNAILRAQSDRTAFLTSGYWWVVKRKASGGWRAFDDTADFERRKDMVIWRADGQPFVYDNFDLRKEGGQWRGLSYKLCHGSSAANDTMREIFLHAARLGVSLVSFDQEIGGGQHAPCYRASHGHPPGYGNWMWTGFRDTCERILKEGKPVQPELGFFLENVSELAIPQMATYWSRQFGEFDHGGNGCRGIALFSYLYHEYVTAIGAACVQGQGLRGPRPAAELRCYILANNLVRGLIPGPFMADVPLTTEDSWQAQVAQAYFSFCKPYARFPEYLVLGVTRRPPRIQCAEQEVWFWRADPQDRPQTPDDPKGSKVFAKLPAVTAGSFEAEHGSVGTVIVNTTAQTRQAVVELRARGGTATLYRPDRSLIRKWDKAPETVTVALEPFATRMLIAEQPRRNGTGRAPGS